MKNNKTAKLPNDMLKAGKSAGKVIGEFKEFISRGNVTDMAVGIVVGTAFTAIVRSLADDVITPLIGLLMGGIDLTELSITINSLFFTDYSVTINYGNFFQSVVSFFIIAVCVFFMVKALNTFRRKKLPELPKPEAQVILLTEIRDLLCNGSPVTLSEGEQLSLFDEPKPEVSLSETQSND
jgi:large conductance mechanosensitive channel